MSAVGRVSAMRGVVPVAFRILAIFVVLAIVEGKATGRARVRQSQRRHSAPPPKANKANAKKRKAAAHKKPMSSSDRQASKAAAQQRSVSSAAKASKMASKSAAKRGAKQAAKQAARTMPKPKSTSQLQVEARARRAMAEQPGAPAAKWPSVDPAPEPMPKAPMESAASTGTAPPANSDSSQKGSQPEAKWSDGPAPASSDSSEKASQPEAKWSNGPAPAATGSAPSPPSPGHGIKTSTEKGDSENAAHAASPTDKDSNKKSSSPEGTGASKGATHAANPTDKDGNKKSSSPEVKGSSAHAPASSGSAPSAPSAPSRKPQPKAPVEKAATTAAPARLASDQKAPAAVAKWSDDSLAAASGGSAPAPQSPSKAPLGAQAAHRADGGTPLHVVDNLEGSKDMNEPMARWSDAQVIRGPISEVPLPHPSDKEALPASHEARERSEQATKPMPSSAQLKWSDLEVIHTPPDEAVSASAASFAETPLDPSPDAKKKSSLHRNNFMIKEHKAISDEHKKSLMRRDVLE